MEDQLTNAQISRGEIIAQMERVCKTPWADNGLASSQKVKIIERCFREIMTTLGLDLNDDSLMETPSRIAKMYVYELFAGLLPENFPKVTTIQNKMGFDEMVTVNKIRVLSVCEHHFVTIDGYATVSYIPNKKIIGLSKINRIVKYFARRPQVQERLTKQIADCLCIILDTQDVAVHITAKHYCVISRGVEDTGSETTTTDLRGRFRLPEVRAEFMEGAHHVTV